MTTAAHKMNHTIAERNDAFRRRGVVSVSQGVYNLKDVFGLLQAMKNYTDFTEDNDPYLEHDFGTLNWENQKVFWKIDYYDSYFKNWCDPLAIKCERLLTVCLAEEQ